MRREQLGAVLGDVHVVFEAHAEFAAQVHSWFIAEHHARREFQLVAAHQVWPLVSVHAHAVAEPV